jgi:hypothetical protein
MRRVAIREMLTKGIKNSRFQIPDSKLIGD